MSAIDMFFTVKVIEGKGGEKRVCLTMNGKCRPCRPSRPLRHARSNESVS